MHIIIQGTYKHAHISESDSEICTYLRYNSGVDFLDLRQVDCKQWYNYCAETCDSLHYSLLDKVEQQYYNKKLQSSALMPNTGFKLYPGCCVSLSPVPDFRVTLFL